MNKDLKINKKATPPFFLILALILNLLAVGLYALDKDFSCRWWVLALWFLAMLMPIIPLFFGFFGKRKKSFFNKNEFLFLMVLVFLSAFLRFFYLEKIPLLSGDETRDAGFFPEAFLRGEIKDFFGYGVYGIPNLFFAFSSLPHLLFGHSVLAIRFWAAFFGVLTVVLTYFLAKKCFGALLGKVAALLAAVYHVHLHFSRSEFLPLFDSFWSSLLAILLLNSLKEKRSPLFLGIAIGLAFHFYQGIRPFLLLTAIYFLIWVLLAFRRSRPFFGLKIGYFLAGLFLGLGPSLVVFLTRFGEIFNTGTAGKPLFLSLKPGEFLEIFPFNFSRSLGSLVYYPLDFHYHYGGPFLSFPFNVFFILGAVFLLLKIKKKESNFLLLWILAVLTFNSAILADLNFTHRLLSIIPAIMIVTALGIVKFARLFKFGQNNIFPKIFLTLIIAAFMFFNLKAYFSDAVWVKAIDTNTKVATIAGYYTASFSPETKFYFLNSSRMGWRSCPTWEYLAPQVQVRDVKRDEIDYLLPEIKNQGGKNIFIFLPERLDDLEKIEAFFPEGFLVSHDYHQEKLFATYEFFNSNQGLGKEK